MGMTRIRLLCSNFRASHRNCKDMAIQVFYMGTCTIPFVLIVRSYLSEERIIIR